MSALKDITQLPRFEESQSVLYTERAISLIAVTVFVIGILSHFEVLVNEHISVLAGDIMMGVSGGTLVVAAFLKWYRHETNVLLHLPDKSIKKDGRTHKASLYSQKDIENAYVSLSKLKQVIQKGEYVKYLLSHAHRNEYCVYRPHLGGKCLIVQDWYVYGYKHIEFNELFKRLMNKKG
jgi:hypothetical protein